MDVTKKSLRPYRWRGWMNATNPIATYAVENEEQLGQLAKRFAQISQPEDCFALIGDLGAGKTSFARAFIRALAGQDTEVTSPTFTLIQTYDSPRGRIVHADLYRLESVEEILAIGLLDQLAGSIGLIEWPQHILSYLPSRTLRVEIRAGAHQNARQLLVFGVSEWKRKLP